MIIDVVETVRHSPFTVIENAALGHWQAIPNRLPWLDL